MTMTFLALQRAGTSLRPSRALFGRVAQRLAAHFLMACLRVRKPGAASTPRVGERNRSGPLTDPVADVASSSEGQMTPGDWKPVYITERERVEMAARLFVIGTCVPDPAERERCRYLVGLLIPEFAVAPS